MEFHEMNDLFRRVFASHWQPEELEKFDELQQKFVFHMVEAYGTLMRLAKIYESDSAQNLAQVTDDVELFFNDAVPHLMSAANIFGDIPQIFEEQNGVHDWKSFVDDVDDADNVSEPTPAAALKPVK